MIVPDLSAIVGSRFDRVVICVVVEIEILLFGTVDPSSGTARAAVFFTHRSDLLI